MAYNLNNLLLAVGKLLGLYRRSSHPLGQGLRSGSRPSLLPSSVVPRILIQKLTKANHSTITLFNLHTKPYFKEVQISHYNIRY